MPADKIVQPLYKGKVQIEFDPGRHTYKKLGSRNYLISVTSATGVTDNSRFLMPLAVKLATTHLRQHLENSDTNSFTREELYPVIEEAARQYEMQRDTAADIGTEVHAWIEMFANTKMVQGESIHAEDPWGNNGGTTGAADHP
jgi:hypothetical protein